MRRLVILLVLFSSICSAQLSEYNLRFPEPKEVPKVCGDFLQRMNSMPADVTMGFYEKDGEIFWGITDDTWLARILKDNKDGVAVDIVTKSQFPCGKENEFANSKVYKGELLKPVYIKDVRNKILTDNQGMAGFKMGELPEKYKGTEYELNMLLIHNGYVCHYNSFFDVPLARWELLYMPLFIDSAKSVSKDGKEQTISLVKKLEFVIPFEKNKYSYSEEDIRPLYDSLSLKEYRIRAITIQAYASVEGPVENNIRLQNNRAEAIAIALEKVQQLPAAKKISAEENWTEFFADIDSTAYSSLAALSRSEIKQKLSEPATSVALEPVLSKHRKAVVTLELESKSSLMSASAEMLITQFKEKINAGDTAAALAIQEAAYIRAVNGELSNALLDTVEIPENKKFITLHNNRIAFRSSETLPELKDRINEFEKLKQQFPGYHSIDYNIMVMKIKAWSKGEEYDPGVLRKQIKDLSTTKFSPPLIKRLFINYHIILSELFLSQRKYEAKNQALKFIYDNYRSLQLADKDLLELAKYFSSYSRLDWAEKILVNRVKSIDADEDLVFYYLNLTIIEPRNVRKSSYRAIVSNAAAKNPKRFCKMFDPYGRGGINFQLLGEEHLKKIYCEVCGG